MELILSVMVANVCPGPRMLGGAGPSSLTFSGLSSFSDICNAFLVSRFSFLVLFLSSPLPFAARARNQKRETLLAFAFLQFSIRIRDARDVRGPRARVQLAEQRVVARTGFQPGDARVLIVHVAEDDRIRRARLRARGGELAIADRAVFFFRLDAALGNALHAVGALLHHAARAHADFRVAHHLELRRRPVLVEEEVETPYLPRAVVRAIPRPDAAVVHHVVQP